MTRASHRRAPLASARAARRPAPAGWRRRRQVIARVHAALHHQRPRRDHADRQHADDVRRRRQPMQPADGTALGNSISNNDVTMTVRRTPDADGTTFSSSSAAAAIPSGATVLWAGPATGAASLRPMRPAQPPACCRPPSPRTRRITATQVDALRPERCTKAYRRRRPPRVAGGRQRAPYWVANVQSRPTTRATVRRLGDGRGAVAFPPIRRATWSCCDGYAIGRLRRHGERRGRGVRDAAGPAVQTKLGSRP